MNFINPVAFALAALSVPIVALYFLKLRREEHRVSSTYLWRTLVRDTAANAPWQRLQPNLLLLLQLLFLLLLVLALVRPFIWSDAASGDHLILVLDTSASMQATDETPNRLAEAVRQAHRLVEGLPGDARITLITAGDRTDVPVSGTRDRNLVYRTLDAIRPETGGSDLTAALNLASAIAAREQDPETVILSDGNIRLPGLIDAAQQATGEDGSATQAAGGSLSIPGRLRYIPIGRSAANEAASAGNQGIMALSLRKSAGGQSLSAFVQVTNFGTTPVERRLSLYAQGQPIAARTLTLEPGQPRPMTFDDLPMDAGPVEARLEGSDALALDDTAWAAPVAGEPLRVDIVGPGNRFLETALSLLPGIEVTAIDPQDYGAAGEPAAGDADTTGETPQDAEERTAGLTIFDGVAAPDTLPPGALLFLAPVQSTGLFSVTGQIEQPAAVPARADEPLLRYVDLRGMQIQSAAQIPIPDWARPIVLADGSLCGISGQQPAGGDAGPACPLLFAGEIGGRYVAVLTFDIRKSDLPLRVAFPLLLANLIDYLNASAGAGALPDQVQPGEPVPLVVPAEARAAVVTLPDGTRQEVTPSGGRAVFGATGQLGPYLVAWTGDGGSERTLGIFTVNLFDPNESAIAPKNTLAVRGSADAGSDATPRQGRQEWWRPLAWLALAILAGEWLYAHRGQVARVWSGLRGLKLQGRV